MGAIASQITSLMVVYSTVYSDADERKHQRSASLAFVWGLHRGPVNSPHKWPITRKMFPFDDVIMTTNPFRIIINPLKADDAMWRWGSGSPLLLHGNGWSPVRHKAVAKEKTSVKYKSHYKFFFPKCIWKYHLWNGPMIWHGQYNDCW